ncbi:MAG: hypothetical protein AAB531_03525 [Patescibacteria group bacterium]
MLATIDMKAFLKDPFVRRYINKPEVGIGSNAKEKKISSPCCPEKIEGFPPSRLKKTIPPSTPQRKTYAPANTTKQTANIIRDFKFRFMGLIIAEKMPTKFLPLFRHLPSRKLPESY